MKLKKISFITILTLSFGIGAVAYAQRISQLPQQEGKEYKSVNLTSTSALMPQKVADKPLVVEIFNYGCVHCYTMAPFIDKVVHQYGDKITHVKISAPFAQWNVYTNIFYALDKLGVEQAVSSDIFSAIHDKREKDLRLGSPALTKILQKHNVNLAAFKTAYEDPIIVQKVANSLNVLKAYGVDTTPAIIVDNKKMFSPSINKGYAQSADEVNKAIQYSLSEIEKNKIGKK